MASRATSEVVPIYGCEIAGAAGRVAGSDLLMCRTARFGESGFGLAGESTSRFVRLAVGSGVRVVNRWRNMTFGCRRWNGTVHLRLVVQGGCLVGASLEFADSLLHFLAGLEGHDKFLRHEYFFARAWISCFSGSPLFDLENAEIPQLNSLVFDECVDNRVKGLLNDLFGLELRETNLLGDGLYDFFFRHDEVPYLSRIGGGETPTLGVSARHPTCSKCNWRKN